jgi:hypothetical protein
MNACTQWMLALQGNVELLVGDVTLCSKFVVVE